MDQLSREGSTSEQAVTSPLEIEGATDSRPPQDDIEPQEDIKVDMDEQATLDLLATAKDQDELERDIGRQADHLLSEQADERDNKRLEKTEAQRQRLRTQLKKVDQKLAVPSGSRTTTLLLNEKKKLETDIKTA